MLSILNMYTIQWTSTYWYDSTSVNRFL